jgi:DNA-directed RNA polymerase sigma subunit (sigma70/sigma32)
MIHTEVQRDRAIPEEDEGERLRIVPDESFEMSRRKVKLVIQVAKKCRGMGATFPNLFQRGNLGVLRAVFGPDSRTRAPEDS